MRKHGVDVLHSLGYTSPFFIPGKNIVTIYDLNWYYQKDSFSRINRLFWKFLVTFSARVADVIITSSQASRDSLIEVLNIPENKVLAFYPGYTKYSSVDKNIKSIVPEIEGEFILTVSSFLPHKNIMRLLEAFKYVSVATNLQLVIVGSGGKYGEAVSEYLLKNYEKGRVVLTGWVSNEELATLYKKAKAFVFVSLYEGFGFPVLEAFVYGTPVISSSCYSLKEVLGDAAEIVDPYSSESISKGILKVVSSSTLSKKLVKKGHIQCKKFEWPAVSKELKRIYYA